jgi:hypothetical protein
MTTHYLKCWPENFEELIAGEKTHEVRKADRNFQVGDELREQEWAPKTSQHTGREASFSITQITPPSRWGLPPDLCVLSIRPQGELMNAFFQGMNKIFGQ